MLSPAVILNRLLTGYALAGAALMAAGLHGCDPAQAQIAGICFDQATVERIMKRDHQEIVSQGQVRSSSLLIVSADRDGNWTAWRFDLNGMACPIAKGRSWEPVALPGSEERT